jgi:hypothetical protein
MNELTDSGESRSYHAILTRMLTVAAQEHAQLRFLVYEFARRNLRKSLAAHFEEGNWAIIEEQMHALESAINKIEADSAPKTLAYKPDRPQTGGGLAAIPSGDKSRVASVNVRAAPENIIIPPPKEVELIPPMQANERFFVAVARFGKGPPHSLQRKSQLIVASILGIFIYVAIISGFVFNLLGSHYASGPNEPGATGSAPSNERAVSPKARNQSLSNMPVPSNYGAFAVSNGGLVELEALSMKAPDPRVAISPTISSPSRTHLPAGRLEFILFRRDLANSAPDKATIRVIARVVRALKFDSGKPATTDIDNTWLMRSNSYSMRVAPMADHPEMILIRPDPNDLNLPAGRYALVLKGTAYDFTLDGPNPDTAHCLERTDALGSAFYSECRTP